MLVNPSAEYLGKRNAVLTGTGRLYHVAEFEGSLSLKTVVHGSATWETEGRHFLVRENSWLILNDRQRYTISINSPQPTTTFCLFFQRGFVEDVWQNRVTRPERLLDNPELDLQRDQISFLHRLGDDADLCREVRLFRRALLGNRLSSAEAEDAFLRLASRLVLTERTVLRGAARISGVRASTKQEICRRVLRGRDLLLSSFDRNLTLAELARTACMSPYHFHRSFRALFGATPHQLLTKHRLQHAAARLRESDDSITTVCNRCGFESLPSFSTLFRRYLGQTPSQFRRSARA